MAKKKRKKTRAQHERVLRDAATYLSVFVAGARLAIADDPSNRRAQQIVKMWGGLADEVDEALRALST